MKPKIKNYVLKLICFGFCLIAVSCAAYFFFTFQIKEPVMSCTLKNLPSMLDTQFDMLRKIAIEDKTRRDKENPVKSCSSVIPDVISIHNQKYILNKMHITVSVDMEWHHFNLIDHDSSML
jgi:hypothetical protein